MDPRIGPRIFRALLLVGVCLGALYLIQLTGERGPLSLAITVSMLLPVVWIVFAGPVWWMAVPICVAFGGALMVGYRIMLHELALLIAIVAMIPFVAVHPASSRPRRGRLTWMLYALALLLIGNWAVSSYVWYLQSPNGIGTMTRSYMHAFWSVLFAILLYRYGPMKGLKVLLAILYTTCLVRVVIGIVAESLGVITTPTPSGFVFSGSVLGLADLRFAGLQLLLLSFACWQFARSRWAQLLHLVSAIGAIWLVGLGGGRASLGMLCMVPLVWSILRRRLAWFSVAAAVVVLLVVLLNQRVDLVYRLPNTVQRAVSVLIVESSTRGIDWHERLRSSNEWHHRLTTLAIERWLESPATFFFGNRVEPYDEAFDALSATIDMKAEIAARLGLYESGLWSVLAVHGAVGMALYLGVFIWLLAKPARQLRTEGIRNVRHVYYFLGVVTSVLWVTMSWIAGGFPSQELMLAAIARAVYEDSITTETGVPATKA